MKTKNKKVIMIGPSENYHGGISNICKIWLKECFFHDLDCKYIPSIEDSNKLLFKLMSSLKGIVSFIISMVNAPCTVYVHTSSNNSFYRKSFYILIASIFKEKICLHIHPTHFYNFIISNKSLLRKYIIFILEKVDFIIVITNDMKKKMHSIVNNRKIFVIDNCINVKSIQPQPFNNRIKNNLLYIGNYYEEKGIYDLVDAIEIYAKKNKNIKLNFYGFGNIVKLKKYIENKYLNKHIKVNGYLNDDEKFLAYHSCSAMVLPSYSEGMPNVILEAMATKTPIIATSVGRLNEVLIDNYNSIIIQKNDPKVISESINKCFENDSLCHFITENAYRDVTNVFDVESVKNSFRPIISCFCDDNY